MTRIFRIVMVAVTAACHSATPAQDSAPLSVQVADSPPDSAARDSAGRLCPDTAQRLSNATALYFEYQVQRPAQLVSATPRPRLPEGLSKGQAMVLFVVDSLGRAELPSFRVVQASDARLGKAVCSVIGWWVFKPAELRGERVRMWFQTAVKF